MLLESPLSPVQWKSVEVLQRKKILRYLEFVSHRVLFPSRQIQCTTSIQSHKRLWLDYNERQSILSLPDIWIHMLFWSCRKLSDMLFPCCKLESSPLPLYWRFIWGPIRRIDKLPFEKALLRWTCLSLKTSKTQLDYNETVQGFSNHCFSKTASVRLSSSRNYKLKNQQRKCTWMWNELANNFKIQLFLAQFPDHIWHIVVSQKLSRNLNDYFLVFSFCNYAFNFSLTVGLANHIYLYRFIKVAISLSKHHLSIIHWTRSCKLADFSSAPIRGCSVRRVHSSIEKLQI